MGKGGSRSDASQKSTTNTTVVTENHNLQDNLAAVTGDGNSVGVYIEQLSDDVARYAMNSTSSSANSANNNMRSVSNNANNNMRLTVQDAIKANEDTASKAMDVSKKSLDIYSAVSREALKTALSSNRQVSADAISAVTTSYRDETSMNNETLIKWGSGAAALVAIALIVKGAK